MDACEYRFQPAARVQQRPRTRLRLARRSRAAIPASPCSQPSWDSAMKSARATASDSGAKSGQTRIRNRGRLNKTRPTPNLREIPHLSPERARVQQQQQQNSTNNSNNSVSRADNSDPVTEKSNPAPVIVATDPAPSADPAFLLQDGRSTGRPPEAPTASRMILIRTRRACRDCRAAATGGSPQVRSPIRRPRLRQPNPATDDTRAPVDAWQFSISVVA